MLAVHFDWGEKPGQAVDANTIAIVLAQRGVHFALAGRFVWASLYPKMPIARSQ
jgi:hypothetical protein